MDRKRGRDEDDDLISCDLSEAKRFNGLTAQGEELLHLLEDMDPNDEKCLEDSEELVNGVIRSLEEEIGVQPSCSHDRLNENIQLEDLLFVESANSLDTNVELGYLLEASDDELGIPPTLIGAPEDQSSSDESCADILDSSAVQNEWNDDQLWPFEDEVSGYDMLEFGYCDMSRFNEVEGRDFAVNNGMMLFEHSDVDQPWRQEATCGI